MFDQHASNGMHKSRTGNDLQKPGVISVLELYTIQEAKNRLKWTDSALRAEASGIEVNYLRQKALCHRKRDSPVFGKPIYKLMI